MDRPVDAGLVSRGVARMCHFGEATLLSLPVVATSATILRGKRRDAASPGGTKDAGCIGFETFLIQNLDKN